MGATMLILFPVGCEEYTLGLLESLEYAIDFIHGYQRILSLLFLIILL